jgi:tRNA1Val (adenine37-N6)-methyltransferase
MSRFAFKRFSVVHGLGGTHKVGTDAVLLGAWARLIPGSLLDLGTGCGVLSLMAAQRAPDIIHHVDAIDINEDAVRMAAQNVEQSPFSHMIRVRILDGRSSTLSGHYSTILCNPPFFSSGSQPPQIGRRMARHSIHLSLGDLASCFERLLRRPEGIANVILPVTEAAQLERHCRARNLISLRRTLVKSYPSSAAHRVLITLGHKDGSNVAELDNTLVIYASRGQRSEDYAHLVQDFLKELN